MDEIQRAFERLRNLNSTFCLMNFSKYIAMKKAYDQEFSKDPENCIVNFQKKLFQDPKRGDYWRFLGNIFYTQEDFIMAFLAWQEASKISQTISIWLNIAFALIKLDKNNDAIDALKRSQAINPAKFAKNVDRLERTINSLNASKSPKKTNGEWWKNESFKQLAQEMRRQYDKNGRWL